MDYNKKVETKSIVVSDDFVNVYKNFNISSQLENMSKLSKSELYLLIVVCLDKHSDEDPVCVGNYSEYSFEMKEIYDIQDDKETTNQFLIDLKLETQDAYIDIDCIIDSNGFKLPEPLNKPEVRDAKIDNLLDGSK